MAYDFSGPQHLADGLVHCSEAFYLLIVWTAKIKLGSIRQLPLLWTHTLLDNGNAASHAGRVFPVGAKQQKININVENYDIVRKKKDKETHPRTQEGCLSSR